MLISPVRKLALASGIHASCSYSIISPDTTHVLYVNPSNRPVRILNGQVLATAEPAKPNTPCSYFSDIMSFAESAIVLAVTVAPELAFSQERDIAGAGNTTTTGNDFVEIKPASPMTVSDAPNLQTIQDTLQRDTVKLEWHPDVGEIDPMGLEHEFRESRPLQPQSEDVEDKATRRSGMGYQSETHSPPETALEKDAAQVSQIIRGSERTEYWKVTCKVRS
jgi:hypothetical protein